MVVWIIGLSGSGKTFLSRNLFSELKKQHKKVKWIDGDKFRSKFSKDLGYSLTDRKKNSIRIRNYCKEYEKKNYIVICSILSIFKDHQKKNINYFKNYFQIFIKVNSKILIKKNNKQVYSKKNNVVGVNIAFPRPYKSDLVLINNFEYSFLKNNKKVIKVINEQIQKTDLKSN